MVIGSWGKQPSHKMNSYNFLKQQNLCSNYTMRSMNYLTSVVRVLFHKSGCTMGMHNSLKGAHLQVLLCVCVKWKKQKVPSPQSENRWECKIRWEKTVKLWMTDQEIFPWGEPNIPDLNMFCFPVNFQIKSNRNAKDSLESIHWFWFLWAFTYFMKKLLINRS